MGNTPKIAVVIVTYNRKKLLVDCLKAVENQEFQPSKIYIIDNASTDGTEEEVRKYNFLISCEYIKLNENVGGAGGFYEGMRLANETGEFDGIWVMDDDGVPEKDCLKLLCERIDNGIVAPLVLDIDDKNNVAFPYLKEKTLKEILDNYSSTGEIYNYANLFNGILFSKSFIDKVGYPKKEMFIWGDENEYQMRAVSNGFIPITIIKAIHYHPKDRITMYNDYRGRKNIIYVDSKLRRYCKYRNTFYILKKYDSWKGYIAYIFANAYYYIISRKFDLQGLMFFLRACKDGYQENFQKHKEFL